MTKITLEMPEEAARKLLKKFEENPEEFKQHFVSAGIEIESLAATFPATKQYRCLACGRIWNDSQVLRQWPTSPPTCGDAFCGARCVEVKA